MQEGEFMEKIVKDETREPMVVQSKMGGATVSELEVKGMRISP